ncbi:hypothetical protein V6N13_005997 [Hibiscus sabdariffa]
MMNATDANEAISTILNLEPPDFLPGESHLDSPNSGTPPQSLRLSERKTAVEFPKIPAFGTSPDSWFLDRFKNCKNLKDSKEAGMLPVRLFEESPPILEGTNLVKELKERFKTLLKLGIPNISLGMVPLSKLTDRSSN